MSNLTSSRSLTLNPGSPISATTERNFFTFDLWSDALPPHIPLKKELKFRSARVTRTRSSAPRRWLNSPPEHQAWASPQCSIVRYRRWGTPAAPHLKNPMASRTPAATHQANLSPQHADWLEIVYITKRSSREKCVQNRKIELAN